MDSIEIDAPLRIPLGRHSLPPAEVARLQRERLLRSVIACSAHNGYQSTTISDIVARAEVSRTAFYELFESKEDCFLEAYAQMAAAMREAVVSSGRDAAHGARRSPSESRPTSSGSASAPRSRRRSWSSSAPSAAARSRRAPTSSRR